MCILQIYIFTHVYSNHKYTLCSMWFTVFWGYWYTCSLHLQGCMPTHSRYDPSGFNPDPEQRPGAEELGWKAWRGLLKLHPSLSQAIGIATNGCCAPCDEDDACLCTTYVCLCWHTSISYILYPTALPCLIILAGAFVQLGCAQGDFGLAA